MRVSFGFTLDHHGVFGIDDVLLHRLFYDGWGLSDCRGTDTSLKRKLVMRVQRTSGDGFTFERDV